MTQQIYTIRDAAAQYFLPPFFAKTDAQAKRMFIGSLGESFTHRADFQLFLIGAFDDDNGNITPLEPTVVLAGLSIPADLSPVSQNIDSDLDTPSSVITNHKPKTSMEHKS